MSECAHPGMLDAGIGSGVIASGRRPEHNLIDIGIGAESENCPGPLRWRRGPGRSERAQAYARARRTLAATASPVKPYSTETVRESSGRTEAR